MDISPLADKQQRNNSRNNSRQTKSEDGGRSGDSSPNSSGASVIRRDLLSLKRIQLLVERLNKMAVSIDIVFVIKNPSARLSQQTVVVEVTDSRRDELLLELKMKDLVEIEKQMNEERVEDLSEFMCGSFLSLTA